MKSSLVLGWRSASGLPAAGRAPAHAAVRRAWRDLRGREGELSALRMPALRPCRPACCEFSRQVGMPAWAILRGHGRLGDRGSPVKLMDRGLFSF